MNTAKQFRRKVGDELDDHSTVDVLILEVLGGRLPFSVSWILGITQKVREGALVDPHDGSESIRTAAGDVRNDEVFTDVAGAIIESLVLKHETAELIAGIRLVLSPHRQSRLHLDKSPLS